MKAWLLKQQPDHHRNRIRDFLYTGVGFTVEFAKNWNTSFFYNASAGNNNLESQNIFWSLGMKF